MIHCRHFLIGAGALLTASFVRRASAFSKKTGRPLILPAAQEPEGTLYVYWQADSEVANWRVSLGPDRGLILKRCCSATTPRTASSSTRGVWAPGCLTRCLPICGAASSL